MDKSLVTHYLWFTVYEVCSTNLKQWLCISDVLFQAKTKTGFFKQAKKAYPMFPCKEEKIKWDEYGEFIK